MLASLVQHYAVTDRKPGGGQLLHELLVLLAQRRVGLLGNATLGRRGPGVVHGLGERRARPLQGHHGALHGGLQGMQGACSALGLVQADAH